MTPLVSVLIVSHNYGRFLAPCLDSVLAQTHPNTEIILVDDGSTDETPEIARGYPQVKYIFQRNAGVSAARNAALSAATGEWIAFLDADDYWPDDRLSLMVAAGEKDARCAVVRGQIMNFYNDDATQGNPNARRVYSVNRIDEFIIPFLIRRDALAAFSGFDMNYATGEDTALLQWFRANRAVFLNIDAVVLHRRVHQDSLSVTTTADKAREIRLKVLADHLRMRRKEDL